MIAADDHAPDPTSDGAPREVTYLFADEPLVCTAGHAIDSDFWILGDAMYVMGGARCDFVEPVELHGGRPIDAKEARQHRCNRTVLFVRSHGLTVVARVSPRELAEMQRQRMTASQVRAHLGLDWRARLAAAGRKR